jgi:uncharacterized RDD family membrane protein YckC
MTKIDQLYGQAIGAALNPIVECMDVDGVVRRIDVNDVVSRIAINDLLDRIDLATLLDRIDWDRQLSRVNFNSISRKLDINDIVGRSDMGAILAQSTAGVFTTVLDLIRTHIVQVDLDIHHMVRFNFIRQHEGVLPPKPGPARQRDNDRMGYPNGKFNKAIAVQGRYTGFFPKAVAIFLDIGFITVTFAVWCIIIKLCWMLFLHESNEDAKKKVDRGNLSIVILFCVYWFLHFFLSVSIAGRTVGMSIVGIMVVDAKTGSEEITIGQAFVRTLVLPLTTTIFPPLGAFGLIRRDGRMFHDSVANTGIVYCWDAHLAMLRKQASKRFEQRQSAYMTEQQSSSSSSTSISYDDAQPLLSEENTPVLAPDTADYSTFSASSLKSQGVGVVV